MTPTFFANKTLDLYYGAASYTPPSTLYVALHTADPTITGNVAEVPLTNGYSRVGVSNNSSNFPAAVASSKSNGAAITFPSATGSGWGTVTHLSIKDSATGGNTIAVGALGSTKNVVASDILTLPIGNLTLLFS